MVSFEKPDLTACVSELGLGLMVLKNPVELMVEWTKKLWSESFSASILFIWHIPWATKQAVSTNMRKAEVPIMEQVWFHR